MNINTFKNTPKKLSLTILALSAVLTLAACSDDKAEQAGEEIDNAISTTKSAVEDAGDTVKDAATDAKDKAKDMATDAGNAIEDACEDAKEKLGTKDENC